MTCHVLRRNQIQALFSPPLLMFTDYLPDLRSVGRWGKLQGRLDAPAAPATGSTSPVVRDRGDILDPTNPEPMTSQHSDRRLGTGTRSPGSMTSRCTNTDMQRSDSLVFRNLCSSRGRLHCRVRGPLQSISLHMLTPRTPRNRLCTSQVGNVNHGIVEA